MNDGADDSDLIIVAQPEQRAAGSRDVRSYAPESQGPDSYPADSYPADSYPEDSYRADSHPRGPIELQEDDVLMLDAYSEDDNAVTQEVSGMLTEARWLVQFTAFDRRMMDTSDVISALLSGAIRRETLVWRGGMDDWLPVGRLDLLAQSAIPTLPPQRRASAAGEAAVASARMMSGAPSVRARPLELVLASVAIALSAATITTSFLSIAGVFDSHRQGAPTHVQALRAKAAGSEQSTEPSRSIGLDQPAPPDPERATAVAH